MIPETTDDKAQLYRYLAGAMATTSLTVRNTNFLKELLDDALDLMDDETKARLEDVSSDIAHARTLLEYVLLELALIDDDLDDEAGRDAE